MRAWTIRLSSSLASFPRAAGIFFGWIAEAVDETDIPRGIGAENAEEGSD